MVPQHQLQQKESSLRMTISTQFSRIVRKAYQVLGEPQLILGKNLSPSTFWFYIDSLYYHSELENEEAQFGKIKSFQTQEGDQFEEIQDLEFILKLRKLVGEQKVAEANLEGIKLTSIDQLITVTEKHLQKIERVNNQTIESFKIKQNQQKELIIQNLSKFNLSLPNCHPMFYFQQLSLFLRRKWAQESLKYDVKQKCYLCSQPNNLISCKSCQLKVHPSCYPTTFNKLENKEPQKEGLDTKNFVCENCLNKVDPINEKCQLCCCIGGHFVKSTQQQISYKAKFNIENSLEQTNAKGVSISLKIEAEELQQSEQKYIHLACFIWNKDLRWNINNNSVDILKIFKKKNNCICSLCGISYGGLIPCSNDSCRRFYHGQCAKRHYLQMNLIRAKTSVFEIFCQRHRHLKRYQSIQQNQINKFKQVKKMIDGLDKQIKRASAMVNFQPSKATVQRDVCTACGKEEGWEKIVICKQCRKWHHSSCSQTCKYCV